MATRRDNGAGTIYKRSNGTWVGRIYLGVKEDGKPSFKYLSGKTEAEVKRKIRDFNRSESKVESRKISVGSYLQYWLRTYKYGTIKPSSYDALERTISNQIIPNIGSVQLQQVTSDDIQKLLSDLKEVNGYSFSVVKKTHDCLNAAFKHALVNGDIEKNPMTLVKMPNSTLFEKKNIRFFSEKECELITEESLRAYKTGKPVYVYGNAFILMLNTGIRLGEAIGLEKTDWDRLSNTLHIQRNIQSVSKRSPDGSKEVGRVLVQNTTKTYSGDRVIPLNKNATRALEELCTEHPTSKYIICSGDGNIVPPERIDRTFYRVLKNVGIEQTGIHSLRHTFASLLFSNGADIKTVSKLLGHASTQITLNIYVHLMDNIEHDTVSKLDDIL